MDRYTPMVDSRDDQCRLRPIRSRNGEERRAVGAQEPSQSRERGERGGAGSVAGKKQAGKTRPLRGVNVEFKELSFDRDRIGAVANRQLVMRVGSVTDRFATLLSSYATLSAVNVSD